MTNKKKLLQRQIHDKTLPIFEVINIFESKGVPVVLRGEGDEINKPFIMKRQFVVSAYG